MIKNKCRCGGKKGESSKRCQKCFVGCKRRKQVSRIKSLKKEQNFCFVMGGSSLV